LYLGHYMTGFIRLAGMPIAAVVAVVSGSFASKSETSNIEGARVGISAGLVIFGTIFALWLIWWIVDIFLISGMLKDNQKKVQEEVMDELRSVRDISQQSYYQPEYRQSGPGISRPPQYIPQQPTYKCPSCGAQVALRAKFCSNCRTQLNWPTQ